MRPIPISKDCPEAPIAWRSADIEQVADPEAVAGLLDKAIETHPANAALHVKAGCLRLDRYDHAGAAGSFEAALRLAPDVPGARDRLAGCWNLLGLHQRVLALLEPDDAPHVERGIALAALDRREDAEQEFRRILAIDPHQRQACRRLCRELRRTGRFEELLTTCEALAARGVRHAQLLSDWGGALALTREDERARRLLADPARIVQAALPVPDGFGSIAAFNAALAADLLQNPYRMSDFPEAEEANRGSSRVHSLFSGPRPDLVRALMAVIRSVVDDYRPARYDGFDPWPDGRPQAARLKAWGLLQQGGEYEEWHLHRGGWLSGVYYVRVPEWVRAEGDGPGCLEFGAAPSLQRRRPGLLPPLRYLPVEGRLILAPSHYFHRTVPSAPSGDYRISFAFDVVPSA